MLKGVKHLILVGSRTPVAFFAYPNKPSLLVPKECQSHLLASRAEDIAHALEWLADELGARAEKAPIIAYANGDARHRRHHARGARPIDRRAPARERHRRR